MILTGESRNTWRKAQILHFMKIRPVGAEFLHVNGQTDRLEGHSRFSQFCQRAENVVCV
jgi:hypothetical protein